MSEVNSSGGLGCDKQRALRPFRGKKPGTKLHSSSFSTCCPRDPSSSEFGQAREGGPERGKRRTRIFRGKMVRRNLRGSSLSRCCRRDGGSPLAPNKLGMPTSFHKHAPVPRVLHKASFACWPY